MSSDPTQTVTSGHAGRGIRFQLLDPLRGLAALWVFTFHYGFSESFRAALPGLLSVFTAGELGVPMFFVISGYCLTASLRMAVRDGESVGSFLIRRSLRIYPAYWCSVAVVAALPFVIEGISALKTGTFLWPSATGNINMGFLDYGFTEWLRVLTLTQVFAPVAGARSLQFKFTTINAVYWTLAIEFQFYLVMATALALRSRAMNWLVAVTLVSLPVWYAGRWNVVGTFLPYWPMFAIGIALYLSIERDLSRPDRPQSHDFLAPLGAIVLTIGFLIATVAGHRTDRMTFAIGFAMVLWCVHGLDEGYRRGLHSESAVIRLGFGGWRILGLMSYSLYLLHGRLQFLADQVCRQVLPAGIARDLAVISMTCASCYVFYRCCERPFIRSRVTAARLEDQTRSPHANATSAVQSLAPVRELPGRTAAHEVIGHGSTSGVARDRSFGARRQQDRASTTAGTSAGDA